MPRIDGVDDNGYDVPLEGDPATGALTTVDYPHHAIHEGKAYSGNATFSLATTASAYVHFLVATGHYPHFRLTGLASDGEKFTFTLYEAPTVATNGTALTLYNRNRNSTKDPAASLHAWTKTSAITVGTTVLDSHYIGGGTGVGGAKSGGTNATDEEWVLKPATKYALKVKNGGANTSVASVRFFAYDHGA